MARWFLFTLLFCSILSSCGNDSPPPETEAEILTVTVDDLYQKSAVEKWIVASTADGSMQVFKKLNNSETIVLTSGVVVPDNKLVVTTISLMNFGSAKGYTLNTYTDIPVGAKWKLSGTTDDTPPQAGNITITSVKPSQWTEFFITNKFGRNFAVDVDGGTDVHTGAIVTGGDKLNAIYRTLGSAPVKHKLLTVKPNDAITLNVNTFEEYDTKVHFEFPAPLTSFLSYGAEADRLYPKPSYLLDFHLGGETIFDTGYMSSLSQFTTYIALSFNSHMVEYQKVGTFPSPNIAWTDGSKFKVTDKSFTNFTATSTGTMSFQVSNWQTVQPNGDGVNWYVTSTSLSPKIPLLPQEIRTQHPLIDVSTMKHYQTKFYVSGDTYEKHVERAVMGGADTAPFERMWVTITSPL